MVIKNPDLYCSESISTSHAAISQGYSKTPPGYYEDPLNTAFENYKTAAERSRDWQLKIEADLFQDQQTETINKVCDIIRRVSSESDPASITRRSVEKMLTFSGKYTPKEIIGQGSYGIAVLAKDAEEQDHVIKVSLNPCLYEYDDPCEIHEEYHSNLLASKHEFSSIKKINQFATRYFEHQVVRNGSVKLEPTSHPHDITVSRYGGANLFHLFSEQNLSYSLDNFLGIVKQLVNHYRECYEKNLIHLDLSLSNVVAKSVEDSFTKIEFIDVLFKKKNEYLESPRTSWFFRSPTEFFQKASIDQTSFSIGTQLFFILTGKYMFFSKNSRDPNEQKSDAKLYIRFLYSMKKMGIKLPKKSIKQLPTKIRQCFYNQSRNNRYVLKKPDLVPSKEFLGRSYFDSSLKAALEERFKSPEDSKKNNFQCLKRLIFRLIDFTNPPTPDELDNIISKIQTKE